MYLSSGRGRKSGGARATGATPSLAPLHIAHSANILRTILHVYYQPSKRTQFLILFLGKTDALEVIECLGNGKTFSSFFWCKCMLATSVYCGIFFWYPIRHSNITLLIHKLHPCLPYIYKLKTYCI